MFNSVGMKYFLRFLYGVCIFVNYSLANIQTFIDEVLEVYTSQDWSTNPNVFFENIYAISRDNLTSEDVDSIDQSELPSEGVSKEDWKQLEPKIFAKI